MFERKAIFIILYYTIKLYTYTKIKLVFLFHVLSSYLFSKNVELITTNRETLSLYKSNHFSLIYVPYGFKISVVLVKKSTCYKCLDVLQI